MTNDEEFTRYEYNDDEDMPVKIDFEGAPETREEAHFGPEEEDILFDAYMMLRGTGVPKEKLDPMATHIELMTVYSRDDLETYYRNVIEE